MAQKFGGTHTEQKLDALEAYLKVFTTALKRQAFHLYYFDAFAGTPDIDVGISDAPLLGAENLQKFIAGSSRRALRFGASFEKYIFVENKRAKAKELDVLKQEFRCSNANTELDRAPEGQGGVLDEWLPLGRDGRHSYSLLFACANPQPGASRLALNLASAVLRSKKRGRP